MVYVLNNCTHDGFSHIFIFSKGGKFIFSYSFVTIIQKNKFIVESDLYLLEWNTVQFLKIQLNCQIKQEIHYSILYIITWKP